MDRYYLPAEWERQSCVQLTWPHAGTDWATMLDEVESVYIDMAHAIVRFESLLIVTPEPEHVASVLGDIIDRVTIVECPTNDTWARDHAFITLLDKNNGSPCLLDFTFNGWGMKFAAALDNQINRTIYNADVLFGDYSCQLDFTLEGGSIESDGSGTLLTTSECLLSHNRNEWLSRDEVEIELKQRLSVEHILWLDHGYLAGDDTDSHIDTLARLCPNDTIAYVKCTDSSDEHFAELAAMEKQLQSMRTNEGHPYLLIPLPWPSAVYDDDGERLPATYANFLVINNAVLVPTYRQPKEDNEALKQIAKAFQGREIIGIDCMPLIRQHGSLHCCTMQYPEGAFKY